VNLRPTSLSLRPRAALVALGALALVTAAVTTATTAGAQELQTDASDPNGAPPPPPPMPTGGQPGSPTAPPPPGSTAAHLQQSTEQDSGVGLHFVYLQPEIGGGLAHLGDAMQDKDLRSGGGLALGVGGGLEFIAFQLGARARYLSTPHFDLWSVGGELAYQPGSGRFWPRVGLGVGWAWTGNLDKQVCGARCAQIDTKGLDVGLRAGFQYFLSPHWEIGADASVDALFLKTSSYLVGTQTYGGTSGTGFSGLVLAHAGFHYP
jgi:hypothetical protein